MDVHSTVIDTLEFTGKWEDDKKVHAFFDGTFPYVIFNLRDHGSDIDPNLVELEVTTDIMDSKSYAPGTILTKSVDKDGFLTVKVKYSVPFHLPFMYK